MAGTVVTARIYEIYGSAVFGSSAYSGASSVGEVFVIGDCLLVPRVGELYGSAIFGSSRYSTAVYSTDDLNSFVGSLVVVGKAVLTTTGVAASTAFGSVTTEAGALIESSFYNIDALNVDVGGLEAFGKAVFDIVGTPAFIYVGTVNAKANALVPAVYSLDTLNTFVGSLDSYGTAAIVPTGVSLTADYGIFTIIGDALFGINGVFASLDVGTLTTAHIYTINGVEAATAVNGVAITGEALTQILGQDSTGYVGILSITGDGLFSIVGVDAELFFGSVDVLESFTFTATGYDLFTNLGTASSTTSSFDYEAIKNLYSAQRTAYVAERQERKVFVGEESRIVFVESDRQDRVVYVH